MIVLKTDNEYEFDNFGEGIKEVKIESYSLYGENRVRNELKIIEVNGFMIRGVEKIVVESEDGVIFRFYNSSDEIIVEYIMKIYEKLIVRSTSLGTLKYNFIKNTQ